MKGVEKLPDDFVIFGCGNTLDEALEDHDINLDRLLSRLKQFIIKLNKDKIKRCQTSVKFYGHILINNGLEPDPSKTSAIVNMKNPSNKTDAVS